VHDPFDDDPAELSPMAAASVRRQEREGLPPSYRMRADAHYVDQLTSRRGDRLAADMTRPPSHEIDAANGHEPPDRDRLRLQLMARLTDGLGAIASASALLAGDASPLARRANIDVIRAEAWRASWLVAAQGLLDGGTRHQSRPRQVGSLLERIRQGFAPECRLGGATLQIAATDWSTTVAVDEAALVTGITGAIIATFGVLGHVEGATVTISVEAAAGELRSIDVAQDEVALPTGATLRFFDPLWTERPGGWIAGIGAAASRAAAEQHDGHAILLAGERRGTIVRMAPTRVF
jgi:hypothetical protein